MKPYKPTRSEAWNYGGKNWRLSRSKINLFLECQACFYIDNKLGIKRPSIPAFQINKAVDNQLKREFDLHRAENSQHPLQKEYGLDAKPAPHDQLQQWRENFQGIEYFHQPTGLLVSGAIDDLWINTAGEYIIVDYKATAKSDPVTRLEGQWHEGYKKQMEIYQWLAQRNGLKVSKIGYFVYCTGKFDQQAFDKKIEFDVRLIPYQGNHSWVEPTLGLIKQCLESESIPRSFNRCEYCAWYYARQAIKLNA